ncbi:FtsW/RodA/SpoVE family cell cycle protein [Bombilactobacillus thymidiniphilus]|uniref:Probable peptidoglycan glycosyltransferase FtsW n=1 Tax=Bombilactobacillus thymidiniphilus TaxID=2923363 RepID=A0ABY4PE14_9LACO|nr:FtsW/RodA/SpoVE family cell cycle protein [Bombilactobacillus thymidiniphilus]UQS83761.1 FtsW/RodA/SpoVE family cell cycle protein [Bombilactobacillus thymidiniphilus]
MKAKLKNIDYWILIPFLLLSAIGIVMVYSASSNVAITQGYNSLFYFKRQLIYVIVGLLGCLLFYLIKIDLLKSKVFFEYFLFLVMIMLLYLLVRKHLDPNSLVNGASAWIKVGPFNIQPLELAKLSLVLYLAKILSARSLRIRQKQLVPMLQELLPPIAVAGLVTALTLFQPDLGGAAILASIIFLLAFSSGIDLKYVAGIIIVLVIIFICGYFWFKHQLVVNSGSSYKMKRLMSFYHPFELEKSGGAQLVNSYYAISNGGLAGRGLGNSIQKLGYLPEPYTDFILSIISEELGVIGVIVVLALLGLLIMRIVYLGLKSKSSYIALLSYGIAIILFVQSAFNIGGVLGILPITGVTLPFISYGGSSQIVLSICIGIILNISINLKKHGMLH